MKAIAGREGERVRRQHPQHGDQAHGEEALHHRRQDVLGPDHAAVEQRQAGDHEHHQGGRDENERGIARIQGGTPFCVGVVTGTPSRYSSGVAGRFPGRSAAVTDSRWPCRPGLIGSCRSRGGLPVTRRYRMARPGGAPGPDGPGRPGVRRLHHQRQHRPLGGPHPGRGAAGPGGGREPARPAAGPRPAGVLGWPAGAGQPGVGPVGRGRAPRPRGGDRAAPRLPGRGPRARGGHLHPVPGGRPALPAGRLRVRRHLDPVRGRGQAPAGGLAGGLPGRARPGRRPGSPPGALRPRGRRPQRPGRPGRRLVARLPARRPGQRPAPGVPGRRPRRPRRLGGPRRLQRRLGPRHPHQRPGGRLGGGQRGRLAVAAHPGRRLLVAGGERALEGPRPRAARPARGRAGHPPAPPGPLDGQGGRRARGVRGQGLPVGPARPHHHRGQRRHLPVGRRDLDDRGRRRGGQGGPGRGRRRGATSAAGLAALFAGYHDPRDLAALGVVRGLDQAGIEFLQAMHAGPRPWSPDYY